MQSEIEVELSMSIFILAYTVGPLFFGRASEVYCRVRLLQISNLWYLAWNLGCGFAQSLAGLFVLLFLAGIGGSAPAVLGGGAIRGTWKFYTLAPVLGPIVGPIAGGFIAEYSTWCWVFWSSSAAAAVIQISACFGCASRIPLHTGNKPGDGNLLSKLGHALVRPFRIFTTQPIITVIALYMGYLFGTTYFMLATFPVIWSKLYSETPGIGGLNYVSIAIGSFRGIALNFFVIDRIYHNLKGKNGDVGRPEFRMPTMFIGSILITIGLFWYGWSVQVRCLQGMQTYTVDSYPTYAASAMATCALLRSLAGFPFPLFAPYLCKNLGSYALCRR
ncbi:uncharacterized protein ATNIH1004_010511 [Aspergillus tanneri]|uniref:Major facilitator superfamily (MFS) profile domain-containing protein n=1 Tax=Aspergillus tanneri TaxID=1220188 RepID=A0A5M9MLV9_9EURO|nr:uncharacterized protein ATNIH1004_010511 [Aspergillus tanneri]KAA8643737.1 hypothetical protein ATNIH1004_010511 [Aspergillus tanneri]